MSYLRSALETLHDLRLGCMNDFFLILVLKGVNVRRYEIGIEINAPFRVIVETCL